MTDYMTAVEMVDFINNITCEPYDVRATFMEKDSVVHVTVSMFTHKDVVTNGPGHKLYMRATMDHKYYFEQGCIDVVLDLIDSLAIHEIREWFTVRGERILNPHKTAL